MPDTSLRFLHLSDLHFRAGPGRSGTIHDRDEPLRAALIEDVRQLVAQAGCGFDGVLVSGDVAFAGRADEYALAVDWFAEVTAAAGCAAEAVWTIPGNHDVDRAAVASSRALQAFRRELRVCTVDDIDETLRAWLTESASTQVLAPVEAYLDFAAAFGCRVTAGQPFWERDFALNDGSLLRLRGMTSVLVSDQNDDEGSNRLVVGALQCARMPVAGVTHVVLCHHPPQWLRDRADFDDAVAAAPVQLYGHMHRQRIQVVDGGLRIFSGALHPDRRDGDWHPQYNALSMSVASASGPDPRRLLVTVDAREWNPQARGFVAVPVGGSLAPNARLYELPLPPWSPGPVLPAATGSAAARPTAPDTLSVGLPHSSTVCAAPGPGTASAGGLTMDPIRRLVYRFMTLPHRQRVALVEKLGLVRNEDDGCRDAELVERYFARARAANVLADAWREVEERHGDAPAPDANPFASRPAP